MRLLLLAAIGAAFAAAALLRPFAPPAPLAEAPDLPQVALEPASAASIRAHIDMHLDSADAIVANSARARLLAHGDVSRPMNLASIRKSVLSLLYGIAIGRGLINPDATLAELGIDEPDAPLTETERRATIRDLLASRSGIAIPAGAETEAARANRPERGAQKPGAHFYYNNWDFNVLGHIFEAQTGLGIGAALAAWVAKPLGLQDFHPRHVTYEASGTVSQFRTYRIFMSARDLARIGSLYLSGGVWNGTPIVSAEWIAESTRAVSRIEPQTEGDPIDGYGYSWWVSGREGYFAGGGWGGQVLIVDPRNELVLVSLNNTGGSPVAHFFFRMFGDRPEPRAVLKLREHLVHAQRPARH